MEERNMPVETEKVLCWRDTPARQRDALVGVTMGWTWTEPVPGRNILLPPMKDERSRLTSIWDKDGIPQYLPHFTTNDDAVEEMEEFLLHWGIILMVTHSIDGFRACATQYGHMNWTVTGESVAAIYARVVLQSIGGFTIEN